MRVWAGLLATSTMFAVFCFPCVPFYPLFPVQCADYHPSFSLPASPYSWPGVAAPPGASSTPPDFVRQKVEASIASPNEMRESLAATIGTSAVDKSTFKRVYNKRVCKPVSMRAKQIGATSGWTVQQLAKKYRNPAHQLDPEARRLYEEFASSPELTERWIRTTRNGCPEDRAYSFEPGDLRGLYAVFVPQPTPDTSAARAFGLIVR